MQEITLQDERSSIAWTRPCTAARPPSSNLRARAEPLAIVRINKSQFSVRVYTQTGEFFDFAYSAIEGARYKRPPTMDLSGV